MGLLMFLIEIMNFGMVPVVTNVGPISSVVTDKQNGLFVKVKDTGIIVSAIKALSENRDYLASLSAATQETILSLFDDRAYIDKLNKLYKN